LYDGMALKGGILNLLLQPSTFESEPAFVSPEKAELWFT